MKQWLLIGGLLACFGCSSTMMMVNPHTKGTPQEARDEVECRRDASQAVPQQDSWFGRGLMRESERERMYLRCLEGRGYVPQS